jgi:hypothetical protein
MSHKVEHEPHTAMQMQLYIAMHTQTHAPTCGYSLSPFLFIFI